MVITVQRQDNGLDSPVAGTAVLGEMAFFLSSAGMLLSVLTTCPRMWCPEAVVLQYKDRCS